MPTTTSAEPSPNTGRVFKVVLFGETGSGKSSIINLLAGSPVAEVAHSVDACTKLPRWYQISIGEKKFRLYDTTGFNQLQSHNVDHISPYEQAHGVLRSFEDVDLILLCARKDGINASLRRIYSLVNNVFVFDGRARIALVVTHCDGAAEDGVQDLACVQCITALQDESPQPNSRFIKSKQALEALLRTCGPPNPPFSLSPNFLSDRAEVMRNLASNCLLGISEAETLVQCFAAGPRPHRVILFGEAGVGKSSVINLIAGRRVAEISSHARGCTLDSTPYAINTGVHQFEIWDTVGLNEPTNTVANAGTGLMDAIQKATDLINKVHEQGGIDLLLLCMRGGRISSTAQRNYVVFQEFLCSRKVPVALVVTCLEHEESFEKAITENPNHQRNYGDKLTKSRLSVQALLEESAFLKRAQFPTQLDDSTRMAFVKKVVEFMKPQGSGSRLNAKELMKRCSFTKEQAEALVKSIRRSPIWT
ncbi:P-loop containing nucleoside triphosphate hydrolase protein [Melanogaster broomeanus]|nr:P-loop containing nucleoside triphosphate hydrolase protein [Melanogaster broomeanus]